MIFCTHQNFLVSGDDLSKQDQGASLKSSSSSSHSLDVNPSTHSWEYYQHHQFHQTTLDETSSFQIMSLLDSAGAPRNCYDRLVALLKKLTRREGFDVQRALNRDTLMRRLTRKYKSRPRIQSSIVN